MPLLTVRRRTIRNQQFIASSLSSGFHCGGLYVDIFWIFMFEFFGSILMQKTFGWRIRNKHTCCLWRLSYVYSNTSTSLDLIIYLGKLSAADAHRRLKSERCGSNISLLVIWCNHFLIHGWLYQKYDPRKFVKYRFKFISFTQANVLLFLSI